MIEFNNFSLILKNSNRCLIRNFNFVLQENDKIAIIGEEGNGKSTLLKSIVNLNEIKKYADVSGNIVCKYKIGYLEQNLNKEWNDFTVMEYFLKDNYDSEIDYDKYITINKIYELFSKFDLNSDLLDDEHLIKTLSGGEKVKIQLIKIISLDPDILLLDEPTNDLDINTLEWLESFINNSKLPILYVSHDETLLENTSNGIIHLEQIKKKSDSRYTIERIGYREYVSKRLNNLYHQEQVARKQRSDYNKQMESFRQIYQKVEYRQNTISRGDPHGAALLKKKMKTLKSQEKRFEHDKENFLDIPDVEEAINIKFDSENYIPNGKVIINYSLDELKIEDRLLSKNIKLNVIGSEHIVIIGKNGIGKSTLLKKIYNELKDRTDIRCGYMPQNYEDLLDVEKTPIDYLASNGSKEEITLARTYMGSLKFTSEEVTNKIKYLSGGQKAKLLLLKLILDNSNVLILDEPTRNLSPLSNPVIRKILSDFDGTIISISHDRKYIDEVCDIAYELTSNGLVLKEEEHQKTLHM